MRVRLWGLVAMRGERVEERTFHGLRLVPVADLCFVSSLISSVDNVLEFLQDEAALDFGSQRLAQNTHVSGIAAADIDKQDIVICRWSIFHQALFDGIPPVFPEERLAGVVHLDHAAKVLAYGGVFVEVGIQGLAGHVICVLEGAIVDVVGIAVGD
jgi:hypothetical protein